jgi:hypothetical protein
LKRIVDRRLETERGDRPDAWHGHEPADLRILARQLGAQAWMRPDAFHLLLDHRGQRARRANSVKSELEARRTGVDSEDRIHDASRSRNGGRVPPCIGIKDGDGA